MTYRRRTPYWNFWKVVFAGWLIRYPGTFFKIFGIPIGVLLVWLLEVVKKSGN